MSPERIRALRGDRTRADLARVLGVTPLTVLRWELPEDNKEARRPRRAMIEALEKLEREAGAARRASEPDPAREAFEADVAQIAQVRRSFAEHGFRRGETELLSLLATERLTTHGGRALATLDLVQQQLLSRLDVRGALTSILPLLADVEAGRLEPEVAARVHAAAAMLFSAPDPRLFDAGRVGVHAAAAERMLGPDDEGRIVLALARFSAARYIGVDIFHETHRQVASVTSSSPVLSCLGKLLRGLGAEVFDHETHAPKLDRAAIEEASRLGLHSLVIGALSGALHFGRARGMPAETLLVFASMAREAAREGGVGPVEPYLRALEGEIDVLLRLGRVDDARRTAAEARELAARSGLPPYASAAAEIQLCGMTTDAAALATLARELEAEVPPSLRDIVRGLSLFARSVAASVEGEFAAAAELADQGYAILEGLTVVGLASHQILFESMLARVLMGDLDGCRRSLRRAEALRARYPSPYHAALSRRVEGMLLVAEGRAREALRVLESTIEPFVLAGDRAHEILGRGILALAELAAGVEGADERIRAQISAARAIGIFPRPLPLRRAVEGLHRADAAGAPALTERLRDAAGDLIARIASPAALPGDLLRATAEVLPDRRAVIDESYATGASGGVGVERWFEIVDARGQKLRFGVEGPLDETQAEVLRTLVASAQRGLSASITRNADPATSDRDPDVLPELPDFVAASPIMRRLRRSIAQLSPSRATVLVTGESGVGKEVVAKAIHTLSARASRPYVAFNCATVPRDLFDSQLFGHRRGAFTGADRDHPGVLRAADKGTVFLDEIGELPLDVQPKLLRFLENGEIFPLGERQPTTVDVRIIAATHRDLVRLARSERFREDLFYRLNVVPLHVPPLRDRPEDVLALARMFLEKLKPAGQATPSLSPDALVALAEHAWPGNVRELRNVLERSIAFGLQSSTLSASDLRF